MTLLKRDSPGPEPVSPGTNWMAIGSFALGLWVLGAWLVLLIRGGPLPGLAAVLGDIYVLPPLGGLLAGRMGLQQSAERGLRGLALAGLVLCSLALAVALIVVITQL